MKIYLELIFLIIFILNFSIFSQTNTIINIQAVGDIMPGSTYPKPALPPNDGKFIFDNVKDYLKNADVLIGNLEGTFTTIEESVKKGFDGKKVFAFKMPLHYVNYLKEANFTVLNIANNHSRDFGEDGLKETIKTLIEADLKYCGLKDEVTIIEKKGVKIGIIGFYWTPYFNDICDIENSKKIIKRIKEKVDILIITFHGGGEGEKYIHTKDEMEYYYNDKRGNVVKFSKAAIDSGADFVFGHGPHIPRAIITYKEKIIAFSLGNFCTYSYFNLKPPNNISLILEVSLDGTGNFVSGRIIPIILKNEGIPFYDENKEAIQLIKKLTETDFPENNIIITDVGEIRINKN